MNETILISIIDGQGGGIGRQLIEKLSARLSGKPNIIIRALGTNALATNAMIKAGANDGATGENAIVLNAGKSILGEVTPRMAEAVGASEAMKILIPVPRCNTRIAVPGSASLGQCIDRAVELIEEYVSHPASSLHE